MENQTLLDRLSNWRQVHLLKVEAQNDESLLNEIATIAMNSKHKDSWRAAWILDKIDDEEPLLIEGFLPTIINQLEKEKSKSKLRHYLRIIGNRPIEKKNNGKLYDVCINIFTDYKAPIASRSFALKILYNIAKENINLQEELKQLIYFELEKSPSPGIKSRCKNILKKLS